MMAGQRCCWNAVYVAAGGRGFDRRMRPLITDFCRRILYFSKGWGSVWCGSPMYDVECRSLFVGIPLGCFKVSVGLQMWWNGWWAFLVWWRWGIGSYICVLQMNLLKLGDCCLLVGWYVVDCWCWWKVSCWWCWNPPVALDHRPQILIHYSISLHLLPSFLRCTPALYISPVPYLWYLWDNPVGSWSSTDLSAAKTQI